SGDGFYPLGLAAFFGHLETARLLLARGADVKQVSRNPMKVQALHSALAGNHREVARALLEAGAPVNTGQQEGWTPLMEAVLHDGQPGGAQTELGVGVRSRSPGKSLLRIAADRRASADVDQLGERNRAARTGHARSQRQRRLRRVPC